MHHERRSLLIIINYSKILIPQLDLPKRATGVIPMQGSNPAPSKPASIVTEYRTGYGYSMVEYYGTETQCPYRSRQLLPRYVLARPPIAPSARSGVHRPHGHSEPTFNRILHILPSFSSHQTQVQRSVPWVRRVPPPMAHGPRPPDPNPLFLT